MPSRIRASSFPVIERERVADRVERELHAMIDSGRLRPGDRLPGERQLAAMMRVSRASLRAALGKLKDEGLITAVHGGATRVAAKDRGGVAGLAKPARRH